ncbi:hypothetical protein F5Y18DRAFT_442910 [Xylariaceae sp. FL1019]|nr:hypothetical protein F5Y18DRAFT_442910 [Xylariaceae sp. FL1019]
MGGDPSFYVELSIGGLNYKANLNKGQLRALVRTAEKDLRTHGLTQADRDEISNVYGKPIEFRAQGHQVAINFSVKLTTPVGPGAIASHFKRLDGIHEGWDTDGFGCEAFAICEPMNNNVAEELGLHFGHRIMLRELKLWFDAHEGDHEVISRPIHTDILTDSLAALQMANKAWHGMQEPLEMIQRQTGAFNNAYEPYSGSPVQLKLREGWVPGHCGVAGNELADSLAKLGLLAAKLIPPEAYSPAKTPIFSLSSMCLYNDLSPLRGPTFPDRVDYPHPNQALTKVLYELYLEYERNGYPERIVPFLQQLIQSIMSSPTALLNGRDADGDVEMVDSDF